MTQKYHDGTTHVDKAETDRTLKEIADMIAAHDRMRAAGLDGWEQLEAQRQDWATKWAKFKQHYFPNT